MTTNKQIKNKKMASDLTVEINGKSYEIQKEVFDLILTISRERDKYHELLKYLHGSVKDNVPKILMIDNIGKFLEFQEQKTRKNGSN